MRKSKALVLHIDEWKHLMLISAGLKGFFFRGMGNETYTLLSPLERSAARWGVPSGLVQNVETRMLFDFKRRAGNYIQPVPSDKDIMEWWALLRHFEGPTRFLDFTASLFVAAYFALANAKKKTNASIWAVSALALKMFEDSMFHGLAGKVSYMERINAKRIQGVYDEVLACNVGDLGVFTAEPFILNNRMRIQQGLFIVPFNIKHSFREHFFAALDLPTESLDPGVPDRFTYQEVINNNVDVKKYPLVKIVLAEGMHSQGILELRDMNITSESLFPGLTGLAKSLETPFALWDSVLKGNSY